MSTHSVLIFFVLKIQFFSLQSMSKFKKCITDVHFQQAPEQSSFSNDGHQIHQKVPGLNPIVGKREKFH